MPRHTAYTLTGATILVLVTIVVDFSIPSGSVHGVPYVVLISLSFWLPWQGAPYALAFLGTLLIIARNFYVTTDPGAELVWHNILMEAAVLWVTAVLVRAYGKSARSLEDREQRLKALIETAVDGVIIIDALGKVQDFNPACERLFGYAPQEVIGNNVKMLMPSPYREEHDRYLRRYRTTGKRNIIGTGREVAGRRKDGSTFPMELSVGEACPGNQQVFVGIVHDVAARHAAEQSLRAAKEQAEAANRAKSVFLANISHEIRTPMNAVLGYTQVIEYEPDLPEKLRRPLKAIRTAGDHLMVLIEEILDLSKIEAGAMELEVRDFDLHALLEGIVAMFQIRCEQKQLQWESSCDIQQDAIRGDDKKLRQILINLLGNAIKFTDSGRVGIHVAQSGSRYEFSITDTGPGITEEGRKRLFEPFQQAEEGARKGGTGLGLTISRRQIELMGGVLGLETTPGQGSRFYFSLELERTNSEADLLAGCREAVHLAPGSRVRALVVDDVEDNREVLSRVLDSAGIEIEVATNGREALDKLEHDRMDVVFMDVRMPVMDGMTAIKHIRSRWPGRRVFCIAITASGLMHPRAYYLEAGFDDFLAKPFRFEKIWDCLEKHLGVVFQRETVQTAQPGPVSEILLFDGYSVPKPLRERLLHAAELNGLTDIETAITELRGLGEETHTLASHLEGLLANYDTEGILAVARQISGETGEIGE